MAVALKAGGHVIVAILSYSSYTMHDPATLLELLEQGVSVYIDLVLEEASRSHWHPSINAGLQAHGWAMSWKF